MEEFLFEHLPWLLAHLWVFMIGACVGSFLNVCIVRLPWEKSILWPGSHCFTCLRPVARRDNYPIISYLRLGGRCRYCGTTFSSRYFWIEVGTALIFVMIFHLCIYQNIHHLPTLQGRLFWGHAWLGLENWLVFIHHAALASFLIAAAFCDLDTRRIPLSLTITGTLFGLTFATLMPWPWPAEASQLPADWQKLGNFGWSHGPIPAGGYLWPVWGPLPGWLPAGSWQLGLATGLAGAAAGSLLLRAVKFVFEVGFGREALGVGDADLMMLVGAFVGWQIVLSSFFVGAFMALLLMIPLKFAAREGDAAMPFGPGLALGSFVTFMVWPQLGPVLQFVYYDWIYLAMMGIILIVGLLLGALVLRQVR